MLQSESKQLCNIYTKGRNRSEAHNFCLFHMHGDKASFMYVQHTINSTHVRCTKCVEERTGYITLFNIMCWISARSSTDNSEDNWLSCHPVWNSRINTRASDLFSTRTKTQFNHIKRCVFQTTTTTSENCFEFRIKVIDVFQKTVLRITNDKYWRLFSWKSTINRCFISIFCFLCSLLVATHFFYRDTVFATNIGKTKLFEEKQSDCFVLETIQLESHLNFERNSSILRGVSETESILLAIR